MSKKEVTKAMMELFRGRGNSYAIKIPKKDGGKLFIPHRDPVTHQDYLLTEKVMNDHLEGKISIGIYPIDQDDTVHWAAVDFDGKRGEPLKDATVVKKLFAERFGIISWLEASQSGKGIHLWVFFNRPIPARIVRKILGTCIPEFYERGEKQTSFDRLFPVQDSAGGAYGNLCALPLNGPDLVKEGRTAFLTENGKIAELQSELILEMYASRNDAAVLREASKKLPEPKIYKAHQVSTAQQIPGGTKLLCPQGCAWLRNCKERSQTLEYPEWYAALTQFAKVEDGELLAHRFSEDNAGYSAAGTAKQFEQAKKADKPLLCTTIWDKFGDCGKRCEHLGVKSPWQLAKVPLAKLEVGNKGKVYSGSEIADMSIDLTKEIAEGKKIGFTWGYDVLDDATELRPGNLIVVAARRSMGKALANGEPVLTPNGWIPIEELIIGDQVIAGDGSFTKVTGVFPQGKRKLFKIEFSDDSYTTVDEDHLWLTETKHERYYKKSGGKIRTTKEIINTLYLGKKEANHSIPIVLPIQYDSKVLPIDPYVFGCWLGDGDGIGRITGTEEIFEQLVLADASLGTKQTDKRRPNCLTYTVLGLSGILRILGLRNRSSYEKFIPEDYLYADVDQRVALLQGLLDTDGTISKFGSVQFFTTSDVLADHVTQLAQSLGTIVRKKQKQGRIGNKLYRWCWILTFKFTRDFIPFRLERKKNRIINNDSNRYRRRLISNIVEAGYGPATCISVDHSSGLFVTRDHIVTHNTAWMVDVSAASIQRQVPHLIFSIEMSVLELGMRFLANISGVDHTLITTGKLDENQWKEVLKAKDILDQTPLFIDDSTRDLDRMLDNAGEFVYRHGKGPIWVDYLQLVKRSGNESKKEAVDRALDAYKQMAKILEVPVISLAQMNRSEEMSESDVDLDQWLKDSGDIEQTSDVILYIRGPRGPGTIARKISLHKDRHRAGGSVFSFNLEQSLFRFSSAKIWEPQDETDENILFNLQEHPDKLNL